MNKTCQDDGKIIEMPIGIFINVVGVISYLLTNFGLLLLLTIGQLLTHYIYLCFKVCKDKIWKKYTKA